jgi:CheY-like chemotaxis protein
MTKIVLLVEDDDLIRGGLSRALQDKGLGVIEAANGSEGLDKALSTTVDLIVTDVIMPKKDGLQMLVELRADDRTKDVPAIILSNDETTDSLNKAMESGVSMYLSKTAFDADAIAEQIIVALGE